jgi:adhesin/invasin
MKRQTAIVGWLTIFTQAALPLSFAYTPLVQAAQDPAAKWYQSSNNDQNAQSLFENHSDTLASAGSALSEGNASGMARSAATGAVNSSIEEWLGQFGTARVQLNLDDKFKAEGSEADLLVPLYENKDNIFFTQLGFRHKDERNTGNLGLGVRHFTGDWMLGANTFFDNDFTGENRRMGVGVEAWRDYLKLSANSYIRLSDWHQSRDFADYDERPANGYDVRAEGWLPAFPQLGAKVMYEQYQGDEVALFGKDNRQKDPWAFTGGVNYTPIPLLTVAAQHRAGKDGQSDSQLSLQMNYRLGESWSKQLDPNLVGASRTLNGTRYDLVERNNSIVLDYRKQETVKLTLPEKTSGKSRTTVPVSFTVETKNPLQRIDWDASALVAAGGSLTQVGSNQLNITLPPYQAAGSNVYRFAGVAYDAKGNSGSATGEIHVEVGEVSPGASTVSADPTTIIADGKSTSTLSFGLFDADGNAVPGMAKSLTAGIKESLAAKQTSAAPMQSASVGPIEETSPGVYQAIVTSGTRVGSAVVSSQFNGTALPDITITESADAATGHIESGAILSVTDNSPANNATMNEVKATITDATGNPLANTAVTFSLTGSATVAPGSSLDAMTDDKGLVSVSFISKIAEKVTVTATLPNGNSGSVDTQFIADSSTAALGNSDLTVDKTTIVANNADVATFSAVVKDANGNPVPNFAVNWSNDKGVLSEASSNTDATGMATVTLKHIVAEAAQVVATAGSSGNINAPVVNFTADNASANIGSGGLTVDKDTAVADDVEFATYTALVKDAGDNPVPNLTVTWATNNGSLSAPTSITGVDGKATITLKSTVAGNAQVTGSVNGTPPVNADRQVLFTADTATANIGSGDLTVDKTTIVANDTELATYTALVKDANGNPVPNFSVSWATDHGTLSATTSPTDADGKATIALHGTVMGAAIVKATVHSTDTPADIVNLIADVNTAKVTTVTSRLTKMTGTGTESSVQTAMVTDAYGNILPAGQNVTWSTTIGSMSDTTTQTDASGKTTSTLINTIETGNSNGTATVTAAATAGSKDAAVTVLPVAMVGGKYYWTLIQDHQTSVLATAQNSCATYGGGVVMVESDVAPFLSAGGGAAFQNKNVSGEYLNVSYRLGDHWTTRSSDLSDEGNIPTGPRDGEGTNYVCVK